MSVETEERRDAAFDYKDEPGPVPAIRTVTEDEWDQMQSQLRLLLLREQTRQHRERDRGIYKDGFWYGVMIGAGVSFIVCICLFS